MHTPLTRFECTPPFGCLIAHPCWSIVFECTPLLKSLNAHTLFKNWYELLFKAVNAKKNLRIYNTPRCNHLNAHPQEIWDEDPTTNLEDNPIWNWKYSHICPVRSNWRWTSSRVQFLEMKNGYPWQPNKKPEIEPGSALRHWEVADCLEVANSVDARACPQKTADIAVYATPLMTPITALGLSIRLSISSYLWVVNGTSFFPDFFSQFLRNWTRFFFPLNEIGQGFRLQFWDLQTLHNLFPA